jgi:hypothetical protein
VGGEAGAPCPNQYIGTCGPGLTCNDQSPSVCAAWCTPLDASLPDCTGGTVCTMFQNGLPPYNGTEYGYCH